MTSPLWREDELAAALGPSDAPLARTVSGVSIDTRTLAAGDLYVAIKGDTHDGHAFVGKAFDGGAAAAIVAHGQADALTGHGPLFAVDDPLKAMERLGAAARARSTARIVAVTGSVGKTSAKEMLRIALGAIGPTHASIASYNNHWGVPLTLARLPREARFGVFEVGMNHAGEIAALSPQVKPHAALITTIAPVHIENLGSIRAIAEAKAEVFLGMEGGVAVLNRDAPEFDLLSERARARRARVVSFGRSLDADARLVALEEAAVGSRIVASLRGAALDFMLGAPGDHMALNALGALMAAEALGADVSACAQALAGFHAQKGRGERVTLVRDGAPFTLLDESYNANPASMRAALTLLGDAKPGPGGRRIAVLGDMLELGPEGPSLHADLAPALEKNRIDVLIGAGPMTKELVNRAPAMTRTVWGPSAADIASAALDAVRAGDVVMVKGSNGSRMGPIVAALRERYAPKGH